MKPGYALLHPRSFRVAALLAVLACNANASCVRVDYSRAPAPTRPDYVDPAYGSVAHWDGTTDWTGSSGGLPAVLNLEGEAFQPDGSLIAKGTDSFLNMAQPAYQPEQVLFRCTAAEQGKLYEFYATNAKAATAGLNEDGAAYGLPGAYRAKPQGMVLRITNQITGEYYSRNWKSRPLTALDTDAQGYLLVKAKNFSGIAVEAFRLRSSSGDWLETGPWPAAQPSGYIAFKGGGLSSGLVDGALNSELAPGWPDMWPGTVNMYGNVTIRRSATCTVSSPPQTVLLGTISPPALNAGGSLQQPFSVSLQCQTGPSGRPDIGTFSSGTGPDQTALAILVSPGSAAAAVAEGFATSATSVRYLLAEGYGVDPNTATGVGIEITRADGTTLDLLSTRNAPASARGWYPVLQGAVLTVQREGNSLYSQTLTATLKKLPGKTVKPGRVRAQAQIIVQVQ